MQLKKIFIFLIILISGIAYYFMTENINEKIIETKILRVIDGDTIETGIGKVRLLGINTPEKGQPHYSDALEFLKQFEGKNIKMHLKERDKYQRWLAYIYFNSQLINEEILKNGLATVYVYEKDNNFERLEKAEKSAKDNELGLWKKSASYGCISLLKFEPVDKNGENETLELTNQCNISLSIIIKDDANHIYSEHIGAGSLLVKHLQNIFNDNGDSLFVRDDSGLLLFYRY